jgi:mannose-1-phosphate guanylyltransferase
MKIIILAGGGGTRLWPISRSNKPKQFSKVLGDLTLFEETIQRFLSDFPITDVYVSTTKNLASQVSELFPVIPRENYIIEPEKRDTAPAMGLAAAYLYNKFPDEPIAYIPSDHFIIDKKRFLNNIKLADKLIRETGKMLDIAIAPTFPSTALGYTQIGELSHNENGIEVYKFLGHTEKPEFNVARDYLNQGNYLWHANYYMWTPRKILEAFDLHSPAHGEILRTIAQAFSSNNTEEVNQRFSQMGKISFDYAITEKIDPEKVLIIKGNFGWSDVGTYDVLYDVQRSQVDENDNLACGGWIGHKTSNCYINNKEDEKLIATVGVEDLVIVNTKDVTLVCRKSKSQDIKELVQKIKEENSESYL